MARRKTTEEFIKDARKVHGDKYDYSKVEYVNKRTKVIIVCPIHGEFYQTPDCHLQGNGCMKCKYENHKDSCYCEEKFFKKARLVHNNKYDYSKVKYIDSTTPIMITCSIHGDFLQKPGSHLQGHGCPKCAEEIVKKKLSSTTENFITKAKTVHGDYYDYSKVVYINNRELVEIICPIHGSFWQSPKHHLRGQGCKICGYERNGTLFRKTTEQFIKDAKSIHGDKYDYSKVLYINRKTNVEIICSEHGSFWQTPDGHLNGYGCPRCRLKEQSKIYEFLRASFPDKKWIWEYKSVWLGQQRIDICCPDVKLAIEYNGPQHYMPILCFGGKEAYDKTVKRDVQKLKLCKENDFKVYIIKYDNVNYDKIKEDIDKILNNNNYENCIE